MQCIHCQTENPNDARYCSHCGQLVGEGPVTISPPVATPSAATPSGTGTAMDQAGGAPAHATAPLTGLKDTQATTAPFSIRQADTIFKSAKSNDRLAIVLGIIAAAIVLATTVSLTQYAILFALAAGVAVYLVSFGFVLPYVMRPTLTCPYCGKPVQALAAKLPAISWPRSCPHCLRELDA